MGFDSNDEKKYATEDFIRTFLLPDINELSERFTSNTYKVNILEVHNIFKDAFNRIREDHQDRKDPNLASIVNDHINPRINLELPQECYDYLDSNNSRHTVLGSKIDEMFKHDSRGNLVAKNRKEFNSQVMKFYESLSNDSLYKKSSKEAVQYSRKSLQNLDEVFGIDLNQQIDNLSVSQMFDRLGSSRVTTSDKELGEGFAKTCIEQELEKLSKRYTNILDHLFTT